MSLIRKVIRKWSLIDAHSMGMLEKYAYVHLMDYAITTNNILLLDYIRREISWNERFVRRLKAL